MATYPIYLEVDSSGLTMAHVSSLPGCFVRAGSQEDALHRLPTAIRDHQTWLRQHGEPVFAEGEPITIVVVEESDGYGPFNPGDAAALFPPDKEQVSSEEMEQYFRLMAHSRADLLDLAGILPDDSLDWQPDPNSFSIRRLLRHIGNAEEWYVSRLVAPETLPPEWEQDENMPILEFLHMERRTALARLGQLNAEERAALFQPSHWTNHPEELWTVRKALRRFLEHEREHTAQIRIVLSVRRNHLLAHLAAARGELLFQLVSLGERTLTAEPLSEGWTVKDGLAHIAGWDRWALRELSRLVSGEEPDTTAVKDLNAFNAINVTAWRNRSLDEVMAELQEAHTAWIEWLKGLPEEEFFRRHPVGKSTWCMSNWVEVFREHDTDEHAAQLAIWRKGQTVASSGPKSVLRAALTARREELLTAAELVPPAERSTRPVCGTWTLQDVLGHIADWESWTVEGLRAMATGRQAQVPYIADEEAWNQAQALARRGQHWENAWGDFQRARRALMDILEGMSQTDLERTFPGVWGKETQPYAWFLTSLVHDQEHAEDIRAAMSPVQGGKSEG